MNNKPVHLTIFGILILLFVGINSTTSANRPLVIKQVHGQYAADFSDDRVLMGASHNVFVGKVVRQLESKDRGMGPETQFEVEVVDNIKGDLKDIIVVNQKGGIKDGVLYTWGTVTLLQNMKTTIRIFSNPVIHTSLRHVTVKRRTGTRSILIQMPENLSIGTLGVKKSSLRKLQKVMRSSRS